MMSHLVDSVFREFGRPPQRFVPATPGILDQIRTQENGTSAPFDEERRGRAVPVEIGNLSLPSGKGILPSAISRREHPDGGLAEGLGAPGIQAPAAGRVRLPALEDGCHGLLGHSRVEVVLQVIERCAAPRGGKEQTDFRPVLFDSLRRVFNDLSHSSRVVEVRMRQDHELRLDAVVGNQQGAIRHATSRTTIDEQPVVGRRSNRNQLSDPRTEQEELEMIRL
jgi:hypothetical protein